MASKDYLFVTLSDGINEISGSEKGLAWYQAGFKTIKPNTWKDFIASGEYLVKNGYTQAGKLIGMGTSAGGVLIGRAITERPDLFAAAIRNVSCSNVLRMENTLNGPLDIPEFGTVKDSTECAALYEMDAFHHVREGTKYPAVLCVGGMNDPRVVVWQPGKFAAALQNATTSGKPVLMQQWSLYRRQERDVSQLREHVRFYPLAGGPS